MSGTDDRDVLDAAGVTESASAALTKLLGLLRRNLELDLRVAAPAHVVTYNPATQRADVAMGFRPVQYVEGEEVPEPPLSLPQVPVAWPGSSAGYLTTPLVPGDTGLVVFTDRALAKWIESPAQAPVDPVNGRTHALGDAVFLPGLRQAAGAITPPTSLAATVLEGPLVWLGAAATQPAVLGTLLQTALNTYAGAITAANSELNTAAQTFYGLPAPTTAPQRDAFATAWAAWNTATADAQTALATQVAAALSTKVVVQQ